MDEALDNPVWHALAALPDGLVIRAAHAARFVPDAAPFFGVDRATRQAYAEARRILGPSREARFFHVSYDAAPAGWRETFKKPISQMILPANVTLPAAPEVRELGPADLPAMLRLARQAEPGPFGLRAPELGTYVGLHVGKQLVAMAGGRFRFAGYIEISAVATHPDHRGRGYGRALTVALARRIRVSGRTPFLHVFPDNLPASKLYESIGFATRRPLVIVWLAPA
jgi:GNAT superfamily N-acetyltransferase